VALNLKETSKVSGSSESEYKIYVFLDLMSGEKFTILMIKAAVSTETFVHVYQFTRATDVHDIAYLET